MVKISESQLPLLKKHISYKLSDYVKRDNKLRLKMGTVEPTITHAQCVKLVEECSGICEMCNCEMLFVDYTPHCLYQFSFDRLDESRPHTPDNLRIICFSCNSTGDPHNKNCINGCHGSSVITKDVKTVKPEKHNTKWSKQDDNLMFDSLLNSIDISIISKNLNRTDRSIDKRLCRLFKTNMAKLKEIIPVESHKLIGNLYWGGHSDVHDNKFKTYSEDDLIQSRKIIELVMSYWDYSKS